MSQAAQQFPMKLYELVEAGPADVVAWSSSGKSFLIVNLDAFCNQILPKHFRHNKLTFFQRQLNLYGFQCAETGRYRHSLFERGRPDLTAAIKRQPLGPNGDQQNRVLLLPEESKDDGDDDNASHKRAARASRSSGFPRGLSIIEESVGEHALRRRHHLPPEIQ